MLPWSGWVLEMERDIVRLWEKRWRGIPGVESGVAMSVFALEIERLCGLSVSVLSSPSVSLRLRRDVDARLSLVVGVGMPGD